MVVYIYIYVFIYFICAHIYTNTHSNIFLALAREIALIHLPFDDVLLAQLLCLNLNIIINEVMDVFL